MLRILKLGPCRENYDNVELCERGGGGRPKQYHRGGAPAYSKLTPGTGEGQLCRP